MPNWDGLDCNINREIANVEMQRVGKRGRRNLLGYESSLAGE